jgi:hypothetical protein
MASSDAIRVSASANQGPPGRRYITVRVKEAPSMMDVEPTFLMVLSINGIEFCCYIKSSERWRPAWMGGPRQGRSAKL